MRRKDFPGFSKPFLVLCEGDNDSAFFQGLIAARAIPDFQVISPADFPPYEGGVPHYSRVLSGLWAQTTFSVVQALLIVADNDTAQTESFRTVQQSIRSADPDNLATPPRTFAVPAALLQKAGADPAVVVMMIPFNGEPGNLESICLDVAAITCSAVAACVDAFAQCTGVSRWDIAKQSKSKLRSLIAGVHRPNPEMGLTFLWKNRPDIVPVNHASFDPIANFLTNFRLFLQN